MNPQDILKKFKKIAVIGISPQEDRPSHRVSMYMKAQGYQVTGVRPGTQEINGIPVVPSLADITGPLEIVDVFRNSDAIPEVLEEVLKVGAQVLWLQEGITHPEAEQKARQAGLIVVSDRCILKEHKKL